MFIKIIRPKLYNSIVRKAKIFYWHSYTERTYT
jgi:hypothetical protein